MILFLYNLVLLLVLALGAPWWIFRIATTRKYREGLLERLGRVRPLKAHDERKLIWIHAVSLGEVIAVSPLFHALEAALPDHFIALSTTTQTGQALARSRFGAERVFYCPLDLPWAVHAHLETLRPVLLILVETEFWPNLLTAFSRLAIPVAVVNARISDRSWPRYRALRCLWAPLLRSLSCVLAQTPTDAQRLCAIGCQADRVHVAGNLKFDVRAVAESPATRLLRAAAQGSRIIVAGSTVEGEESVLIALWPRLIAVHPYLVLVLAPRHPERFSTIASLLSRSGLRWQRRSDWPPFIHVAQDASIADSSSSADSPIPRLNPGEIVLLDSIGELSSVYSLATIAFVGGSLVSAGGHNPLEPAQFSVPIVMGPSFENFRSIVELLIAHNGIRIINLDKSGEPDQLYHAFDQLLSGNDPAMGARAREIFDHQAGATQRTVAALQILLGEDRP